MRMRTWCFTLNNPTGGLDWVLPPLECVKYYVYQFEAGESGTLHAQGYIEFKKSMRMQAVKDVIGDNSVHLEKRKGTQAQARDYCMKADTRVEGTEPIEYGDFVKEPGKRNDLNEIYAAIKNGKRRFDILNEWPSQYIRYSNGIEKALAIYNSEKAMDKLIDDYCAFELREWQEQALVAMGEQNDRQVLWIYDEVGNSGKSFLGTYLLSKGACLFERGSAVDLAYQYNFEDVVVFDLCRSSEYMPYQMMESLKNGRITSTKYQSCLKITPRALKVIVFSNALPDMTKLSMDRWVVKTLINNRLI